MADNRLELIISLLDDTAKGIASYKRQLKSMEEGAAQTAAKINKEFSGLTPAQDRSLNAWIRRSEMAGKTGEEKIVAQANQLKARIGDVDAKITAQIDDGTNKQREAWRRRQEANDKAQAAANKKATERLVADIDERVQVVSGKRATPVQRTEAEMNRVLAGLPVGQRPQAEASYRTLIDAQGKAALEEEIKGHQNTIRDLEARAGIAGKKTSERLGAELKDFTANFKGTPEELKRGEEALKSMIATHKKIEAESGGHGVGTQALRRVVLGVKDFAEGSTRGAIIEGVDVLVGTSGSGGVLPTMAAAITNITGLSSGAVIAIGGLTAAFAGLGIAGLLSVRGLAETGQKIKDFSERTGIHPENVQHFQYAAKAEGADPAVFERSFRGLAQATDEDSTSGVKVRKELKNLGVDLYDEIGRVRPTEDIMLGIAEGLSKLPPGLQQSAASMEIFKRAGAELLPVLLHLRENVDESKKVGGSFTQADLAMFDEWHKEIVKMDLEWERFKARIEKPLAIAATMTIHLINAGFSGGEEGAKASRAYGSPYASVLEPGANDELAKMGVFANTDFRFDKVNIPRPKPPGVPAGMSPYDEALKTRKDIDSQIRAMDAEALNDPQERLRQAQKELSNTPKPELGHATQKELNDYKAAVDKVKAAQRASRGGGVNREENKALQGVIAARNEGLRLDTEYAKQQFAEAEQLSRVELDSKNELSTPEQTKRKLDAAFWVAQYQTRDAIESRRKMIDTKTGREVDLSNTPGFRDAARIEVEENLPKRIRDEQFKVLTEMAVNDTKYYKNRADESMKHADEEWHRRQQGELDIQNQTIALERQSQDRRFQVDIEANDRAKTIALDSLGSINAQTLKGKMALEDQKFAIEKDYTDRGLVLQIQRLTTQRALAIGEIEKNAREHGINPDSDENTQQLIQRTGEDYDQRADALRSDVADKETMLAMRTAKTKEDLQIQSNRKIYDSLKQDAAGLFDQLVSHTKSWADFAKDLFKSAILTPVKDIFSSQVAGLFTGLITGNKVTFDPVGTGEGKLGGIEGALGRAGLGQPHFNIPKSTPLITSKLEQPNHIGDVSLLGGAVPVVIVNASTGSGSTTSSSIGSGLANSFGSFILNGARNGIQLRPDERVHGTAESTWVPLLNGLSGSPSTGTASSSITYGGISPNGFPTMGEISGLGTPEGIFSAATGTNPWAIPTPPPYVDSSLSGVQLADWANPNLGPEDGIAQPAAQGGFFSKIGQMFGLGGGNVKGTPPFLPDGASGGGASGGGGIFGGLKSMFGLDTAGTDMGGGVGIARSGFRGNLAAITKSSGFALAGGIAAMDGIRRGGVLGTLEATAGGAAVGFKFGGFLGAGIGAAIGGGLALAKTFGLFGGDEKHAKDLVKQVYGVDINDATAKSIVQIAKQSFGGQIDVAVRSPQVRELLKLYSQATGQKKAEDMFVQSDVHSLSLVESNRSLMQSAVYDNGNAYAYSSRLGTYGGVQTSPLSTYQPGQGVFNGTVMLNVNGQSAADLLDGRVANTVTPNFVQNQSLSASKASYGRTAQQNMALSPSALAQ